MDGNLHTITIGTATALPGSDLLVLPWNIKNIVKLPIQTDSEEFNCRLYHWPSLQSSPTEGGPADPPCILWFLRCNAVDHNHH